jgi:hypothetical protein
MLELYQARSLQSAFYRYRAVSGVDEPVFEEAINRSFESL